MHCYCSFKGVVCVQPEDRPAKIKINIVNTERIMSKDIRKPWRLMLATDRERCICKESSSFRDGVRLITTHCKHLNTYTLCHVTLLPGHSTTCTPPTSVLFFLSIFVLLVVSVSRFQLLPFLLAQTWFWLFVLCPCLRSCLFLREKEDRIYEPRVPLFLRFLLNVFRIAVIKKRRRKKKHLKRTLVIENNVKICEIKKMVIYNFKHSWRSFVVLCLNLFFSEMSEYEHVEGFLYIFCLLVQLNSQRALPGWGICFPSVRNSHNSPLILQ